MRRNTLRAALLAAGIGYLGLMLAVFALQTDLLYDARVNDRLSAPGGLAIPGSERVEIATPDGERLAGWYLAPQAGDRPVYLFLHGKGGKLEEWVERWREIKAAGEGVLAFSYRGFPGSTGHPSEEGLAIDARAAFDWLAQRHAPADIVIHGLSLGTGVGTALATDVDARALVLEAPFTSIPEVAAERYPLFPVHILMTERFASIERIGGVRMPLLIVHGTADTSIPIVHADRLFEAAAEPKRLIRIENGGHETLVQDGLYRYIREFLAAEAAAAPAGEGR